MEAQFTYHTHTFAIGKTNWEVIVGKKDGQFFAVDVYNMNLPRAMRTGKRFYSINAAIENYRKPEMKMHIELAAIGM